MVLRPAVIKGDHNAMNNISNRIKKSRKIEHEKRKAFKMKHDEIRKGFQKQLESNFAWENRMGIAYKNSMKKFPKV